VFAAASALREAAGLAVPVAKRAVRDGWVAAARGSLDDAAFAAAWAGGRALDFEQAAALATDLPAAPAALAATAAPGRRVRAAPDDPAAPLTPREREVALLVARGLTNREIAAALVITERTAETHVEHILGKLGFRARAQIATWVGGRGLLAAAESGGPGGESRPNPRRRPPRPGAAWRVGVRPRRRAQEYVPRIGGLHDVPGVGDR
jgi:DNA-binding CsgD family transcriptional regulator